MRRFGFALPAVALMTLLAAAPVALAQSGPTFSMTIDKTATFTNPLTNPGILLHVTGTYTCADLGVVDPNQSGLNVNVNEIVKNYIVSGGGGPNGNFTFTCDGTPYAWSADLFGNNSNNLPALWKTGKAMAQAGGNICGTNGCAGTNVQRVITIKH
jgi:hypothetical protein